MSGVELAEPRNFLIDRRFDIGVKHLFFSHLLRDDDPDSERLYRWHIEQRTGGVEKGSWKKTVEDYVAGAHFLLASMQSVGFDTASPIELGSNGVLMAGAHRVACALLLNLPVAVRHRAQAGRAAAWDLQWFTNRGLGLRDRALLVRHWIWLNNNAPRTHLHPARHGAPGQLGLCLQGRAGTP